MDSLHHLLSGIGALILAAAVIAYLVSSCFFLIKAFNESILWGLACIFVPLAALIYTIKYWADVRKIVLGNIAATVSIFLGFWLISFAPGFQKSAMDTYQRQQARLEALKTLGEETGNDDRETSRKLRQLENEYFKQMKERERVAEYRQRATELYGFVQTWHQDLMSRRPGENASEREKEEFRVEHANYTGLLKEYKMAMKQMQKEEAHLARSSQGQHPLPAATEAPAEEPTVEPTGGEGLKPQP